MYEGEINWSKFTGPKDECLCRCGAIFHSHTKWVLDADRVVSQDPCPRCGQNDNLQRVSSPPEIWGVHA